MGPFQLLFRTSLVFMLVAVAVSLVLRGDGLYTTLLFLVRGQGAFQTVYHGLPLVALILFIGYRNAESWKVFAQRLAFSLVALVVCCVFLAAFSSMKSSLPLLADLIGKPHFFADPFLAELDRVMHFGVDPWVVTHAATAWLGIENFATLSSKVYGLWWAIPAFYLPAIILLWGDDRQLARHYVSLYLITWVLLGNVFALIGFSAGPVFYDLAFGTERYPDLHVALAAGGLEGSWFGRVQTGLWEAYSTNVHQVGTGISAFPSLHLAMATVTALYLAERGRTAAVVGWVFVAVILFLSVWTGYHYALDGYFSIIAVYVIHRVLQWRAATAARPTPSPVPAE